MTGMARKGVGASPPEPMPARHGEFVRRETAGTDEVDAHGVEAGQAVRSSAVGVGGRLGKAGEEVGVAVGRTFLVFQLVCVGGKNLQPTLTRALCSPTLAVSSSASWSE